MNPVQVLPHLVHTNQYLIILIRSSTKLISLYNSASGKILLTKHSKPQKKVVFSVKLNVFKNTSANITMSETTIKLNTNKLHPVTSSLSFSTLTIFLL